MKSQRMPLALLAALLLGMALPAVVAAPAHAAASVSITNSAGAAQIDGTYATTLTISGSGFQSIKNSHGGIYVWFGTVNGTWQPSKGGVSGRNYLYIPDSESANNKGFQRFIAFPGSDTASSAAATMSADGSWRTTITVPGATFKAVGRNGAVTTVDCRKQRCGVITVGAHGVKNANNETFTPVTVGSTQESPQPDPETSSDATEETSTAEPTETDDGQDGRPETKVKLGKPKLEVDRSSAIAGRILSFNASGLTPDEQVSVVFDDGRAAAGPFLVGENGRFAGVITLPADLPPGTYELRIFGVAEPPSVKFAVRGTDQVTTAETEPASSDTDDNRSWSIGFVGFAVAMLAVALVRLLLLARGRRAS